MTARKLTAEELIEIREQLATTLEQGGYDYDRTLLLDHTEALEVELEWLRLHVKGLAAVADREREGERRMREERDRLRAENERLKEELWKFFRGCRRKDKEL